ncbi:aminopeptidase P N-terminal domain-containing protein [Agreia pratensis]|uniref:aminopeptidase P family protein n=1 Tax=Agreia pratensis TaxID=150121 RepID=UPI00188BF2B7|nr:aminopeptidase P family protein [Agreia pratensis]MBF4635021.1 aminopeptidase P N-terminal domain-containing protein [Agreia pratensis]
MTTLSPAPRDPRMPRLPTSETFREFMASGWAEPDRTARVTPGAAEAASDHRARLSARFPADALVVASGRSAVRSNDTEFGFRPHSDFAWLTGCVAEAAVVVMRPTASGHDAVLYLTEPAYAGEEAFYADAMRGELWVGAAPGLDDWASALQIEVRSLAVLADDLRALHGVIPGEVLSAGAVEPALAESGIDTGSPALERVLSDLKLVKDEWEISQLRAAVDATVDGFAAVVAELPTALSGRGERWLQATFERHSRQGANGVGYTTVMGSGPNAATLHWSRCDGPVSADHLVLLDAGVEVDTLYTADVTRVFPASGTFSPAQRRVYELVLEARAAALATLRPGALFSDFQEAAHDVIARGLHGWGILPGTLEEALSPEGQYHRRYAICGNGHHLGLDVHDCAKTSEELYLRTPLVAGMVLTVEPGIYFHANDLTLPEELRGIGVRIEDDLLITESGYENLSGALPVEVDDVEAWVRSLTQ